MEIPKLRFLLLRCAKLITKISHHTWFYFYCRCCLCPGHLWHLLLMDIITYFFFKVDGTTTHASWRNHHLRNSCQLQFICFQVSLQPAAAVRCSFTATGTVGSSFVPQ